MTLNGHYALHCTKHASFGAHHEKCVTLSDGMGQSQREQCDKYIGEVAHQVRHLAIFIWKSEVPDSDTE